MVAIHRHRGSTARNGSIASYFWILLIVVFVMIFGLTPTSDWLAASPTLTLDSAAVQEVLSLDVESRGMRIWRLQLQSACQSFLLSIPSGNITKSEMERKAQLESEALTQISIPNPDNLSSGGFSRSPYQACDHIFIDLGTNRGDSIACAVDASLDICSALFVKQDPSLRLAYRVSLDFPRLHFDAQDLRIHGSGNQGLSLLRLLQDYFANPGMESVCVYGMEGNPYFTNKLKQMEYIVNGMNPRPLKHLYIHTETIVSSKDGPASLYIDQYSDKNHFWGSSVLESMPDIRKTSRKNNGTTVKADVTGMTLSTLLQRTLKHSERDAPSAMQFRRSLLVKMDVEGAEFGIVKEIAASNVLCDYVQLGNNATIVVEFHQHLIKDPEEKSAVMAGIQDAKEKLRRCGVKLRNLPDFWT